jgi:hypothetical protein
MKTFQKAGNKHKGGKWPPSRKRKPEIHENRANEEAGGSDAANKEPDTRFTRHGYRVGDPVDTWKSAPGQSFALTKQASKSVGKSREPADLQHERHPRKRTRKASGSGEPRYGRQTLRSISCPLVSAVLVLRPRPAYRRDRDPLTLLPFRNELACRRHPQAAPESSYEHRRPERRDLVLTWKAGTLPRRPSNLDLSRSAGAPPSTGWSRPAPRRSPRAPRSP